MTERAYRILTVLILSCLVLPGDFSTQPGFALTQSASDGIVMLVTRSTTGGQGNSHSGAAGISDDGSQLLNLSWAFNLVEVDTNNHQDVFVTDWRTNQTVNASVSSSEFQANADSRWPALSGDGRFVAFESAATNLVPIDTNGAVRDIFYRDLVAESTVLVSTSTLAVQGNDHSMLPSISDDGSRVAFESYATNLVSSVTTGYEDVFVKDMDSGEIQRVSVSSSGTPGNGDSKSAVISGNGQYVAFFSYATNLITDQTTTSANAFLRDLQTDTTTLIAAGATPLDMTPDGRFVVLQKLHPMQIFLLDSNDNSQTPISVNDAGQYANNHCYDAFISADGSTVAFYSTATNLVPNDNNSNGDIFIYTVATQELRRLTTNSDGEPVGNQVLGGLSADGRYLGFSTTAKNWGVTDTNNYADVYLEDNIGIDLSIDAVEPVQVVEGATLVKGKATAIKAVVHKTGRRELGRVYLMAKYGTTQNHDFYVAEPSNLSTDYILMNDDDAHALSFATEEITKTVYFADPAYIPTGSQFLADVTVDDHNYISEINEYNNTRTSGPKDLNDINWSMWGSGGAGFENLRIHFFLLDFYDPLPNSLFDLIEKEADFIKSVFPVSEARFQPVYQTETLYYSDHLWDSEGMISQVNLLRLLNRIYISERISDYKADRFIAVVPHLWFVEHTDAPGHSYGLYLLPFGRIVIEPDPMNEPTHHASAAHELGHSYGLPRCRSYDCNEEYLPCNMDLQPSGIGNAASPGLWVEKRLLIPAFIDTVTHPVYCMMGRSPKYYDLGVPPETQDYWIEKADYEFIIANAGNLLSEPDKSLSNSTSAELTQAILVSGWVQDHGDATLDDWYLLPQAEIDYLIPGDFTFNYYDSLDNLIHQESFDLTFLDPGDGNPAEAPFALTIPYADGTAKITITVTVDDQEIGLGEKTVSPSAPVISLVSPNGGESLHSQALVQWSGSDADLDTMHYAVLFSQDDGLTWSTLETGLTGNSYFWDLHGLTPSSQYRVKVIATDGFNTSEDISSSAFTVLSAQYLPMIIR